VPPLALLLGPCPAESRERPGGLAESPVMGRWRLQYLTVHLAQFTAFLMRPARVAVGTAHSDRSGLWCQPAPAASRQTGPSGDPIGQTRFPNTTKARLEFTWHPLEPRQYAAGRNSRWIAWRLGARRPSAPQHRLSWARGSLRSPNRGLVTARQHGARCRPCRSGPFHRGHRNPAIGGPDSGLRSASAGLRETNVVLDISLAMQPELAA